MNTKRTIRVAILGLVVLVAGLLAAPALAAGPSVGSIYTSVNPARAGQDVSFTVVVEGTFQSPLGFVQLFDGFALLGPPLLLSPDFDSVFGGPHIIPTDHSTATVLTRSFSPGTHLITLDYTGDGPLGNLPIFGGGVISLVVTGAPSTTSVSSSANPSVSGQNVTFTASTSSSGSPAAGSIQFTVDGSNVGSPVTVNASGNASVSTSTLSLGNHPVTADFTSSDADVLASSGSLGGGQVVDAADTTTAVSSSGNPSEFGGAVTFTSSTTVNSPGAGTPGGTVQFQDNGSNLGSPQSLAGGQASITTSGLSVGTHAISATYASDSPNLNSSAGSESQIVNKARTVLNYDGAITADFDDPVVLSARLGRVVGGSPVTGQSVTLTMGAESCSSLTDSSGEAVCTITPSEPAGPLTVTAVFGGDGSYESSTDSKPFTVTREETTTTYTGPTVIAQGNPVKLTARLLEDGVKPIAGRTLTLTLGTGLRSQHCVTGPTDAAGNANCTLPSISVSQGPEPVRADFAGDGYYLPSADATKSVIVFAFLHRGIFVLGDKTVAAAPPTVSFWSDQWWKLNSLTGGSAPASFKGFGEYTSSKPPACGGTWKSSPGNSSSPDDDDDLPAYMGVAVASSITKSGNTISGNITKIVVVMTAHGHSWDHDRPGTGTVVATYC